MALPSCKFIINAVADEFGVLATEILSPRRSRHLACPRMVAYWLAYKITSQSYMALGERFERDHTTVLTGVRRIETTLRRDPQLRGKVMRVLGRIERMQSKPHNTRNHGITGNYSRADNAKMCDKRRADGALEAPAPALTTEPIEAVHNG